MTAPTLCEANAPFCKTFILFNFPSQVHAAQRFTKAAGYCLN